MIKKVRVLKKKNLKQIKLKDEPIARLKNLNFSSKKITATIIPVKKIIVNEHGEAFIEKKSWLERNLNKFKKLTNLK